ncbi:hypothetical protein ZWY2020_058884 [Hordeum vulgare]|nr:hypothetical protein ZWY2020_058884 [Hordeum vulgare]
MAGGDSSPVAAAARKFEWAQEDYRFELAEESLDPRYSEYDPKQGCFICVRYCFDGKLDLDEESPVGPMRHTGKIFKEGFPISNSVNVVSIKIVSSDYGYPLNVYGTIIARDSLDRKRVYVFRRDQDDCQLISSKDDSLILTGPKRGFMVYDDIFFETNLKVKDVHGRTVGDDRLSKGLMEVDAIRRLEYSPRYVVDTETLVSMHSTLDLNYTFIRRSVEGTVEIKILDGPDEFRGKIVASTTSIPCDIVLHDSKVSGALTAGDNGVLQMARRIVGVSVDEMLVLTVAAAVGDDALSACTVQFTPRRNGYDDENITCGDYKMLLKENKEFLAFRKRGPEHLDEMSRMFENVLVTGESSFMPGTISGTVLPEGAELHNLDDDDDDEVHVTPSNRGKRGAGQLENPKKKNPVQRELKRMVDHMINEDASVASSKVTIVTEIEKIMEEVVMCGAKEGSDEHYIATKLFAKLENRAFFRTFKTNDGKMNWLRRMYEDRRKN